MKRPVAFAEDCVGPKAEAAVAAMKNGDILCLENTRFHAEEKKNDKDFAKQLAALGDIFVDDAFSAAHREHASNTAIVTASNLAAYPGRAMKAELDALEKAFDTPQHPVAAIVGGAKISTKLDLLGNLLLKVETLIIGGGMANTFLAAQGKASANRCASTISCRRRAISSPRRNRSAARSCCRSMRWWRQSSPPTLPGAWSRSTTSAQTDMILDIGPRSIERVVSVLGRAKTLVWNGPFGAFECKPFDNGTIEIAEAVAELTTGRQACQLCRRRRHRGGAQRRRRHGPPHPCLDRRRRLSGMRLEGKPLPGVKVLMVSQTPAARTRIEPIRAKRRITAQNAASISYRFPGGRDESRPN